MPKINFQLVKLRKTDDKHLEARIAFSLMTTAISETFQFKTWNIALRLPFSEALAKRQGLKQSDLRSFYLIWSNLYTS